MSFRTIEIHAQPEPAADIDDCIKEAIVIAMSENRVVQFQHGVKCYKIYPWELRNSVYRDSRICQQIVSRSDER